MSNVRVRSVMEAHCPKANCSYRDVEVENGPNLKSPSRLQQPVRESSAVHASFCSRDMLGYGLHGMVRSDAS